MHHGSKGDPAAASRRAVRGQLSCQQERLEEDLDLIQIEAAIIEHGELLEEYPDDPRGESCLVLGFVGSRPLHAVLGWATMKVKLKEC
jgi:hypothetical protein